MHKTTLCRRVYHLALLAEFAVVIFTGLVPDTYDSKNLVYGINFNVFCIICLGANIFGWLVAFYRIACLIFLYVLFEQFLLAELIVDILLPYEGINLVDVQWIMVAKVGSLLLGGLCMFSLSDRVDYVVGEGPVLPGGPLTQAAYNKHSETVTFGRCSEGELTNTTRGMPVNTTSAGIAAAGQSTPSCPMDSSACSPCTSPTLVNRQITSPPQQRAAQHYGNVPSDTKPPQNWTSFEYQQPSRSDIGALNGRETVYTCERATDRQEEHGPSSKSVSTMTDSDSVQMNHGSPYIGQSEVASTAEVACEAKPIKTYEWNAVVTDAMKKADEEMQRLERNVVSQPANVPKTIQSKPALPISEVPDEVSTKHSNLVHQNAIPEVGVACEAKPNMNFESTSGPTDKKNMMVKIEEDEFLKNRAKKESVEKPAQLPNVPETIQSEPALSAPEAPSELSPNLVHQNAIPEKDEGKEEDEEEEMPEKDNEPLAPLVVSENYIEDKPAERMDNLNAN